jgi:hypothetical protein
MKKSRSKRCDKGFSRPLVEKSINAFDEAARTAARRHCGNVFNPLKRRSHIAAVEQTIERAAPAK